MSQDFVFTSKRPQYSLALFSNFICTCTTLIYSQKDPRLLSKEFPKYANVAEMVKTMSVASLFHHERRRNKSLGNIFFAFLFPFCDTCRHSRYFHWYGDPSIWRESNRGSFWTQIRPCLHGVGDPGRFLLFCVPQSVKTKETNSTRPGSPTSCKQALSFFCKTCARAYETWKQC